VGAQSPVERVDALDREQDEIEADLGADYLQRRREQLDQE
jgi:hypothetical protein